MRDRGRGVRETLADRRKVQEGMSVVNAIWKTQGAAVALRYVHHLPHGRALPWNRSGRDRSIIAAWTASTAEVTATGRRSGSRPVTNILSAGGKHRTTVIMQTAAQMLFSAASCYHLAGYMHHDIGRLLPETRRSMLRAVETLLGSCAPLLSASHNWRNPVRWNHLAGLLAFLAKWSARRV